MESFQDAAAELGYSDRRWRQDDDVQRVEKVPQSERHADREYVDERQLESSFASSPNLNLDDNALLNLSKSALSLQRLQQAQVLAFDQATDKNGNPLPVSGYSKWATKWSTGQDVRAFGWDLMTPAERKRVWNSIPADKRDAFKQSVGLAQSLNLFSPGATANAQ